MLMEFKLIINLIIWKENANACNLQVYAFNQYVIIRITHNM